MFRSIRAHASSTGSFFALAFGMAIAASSALGCSASADPAGTGGAETAEQDVWSLKEPAIHVNATWQKGVTGTPTYGFDATEAFLSVDIVVDDETLRVSHRDFDGHERPFALLPRKGDDGGVRWERLPFAYKGESIRGYFSHRRVDLYALDSVKLSEADLETVLELGVAIGLESNAGTIWAQDAGNNFIPKQSN